MVSLVSAVVNIRFQYSRYFAFITSIFSKGEQMKSYIKPQYSNSFRPSQVFCESKNTSAENLGSFHLTLPSGKTFSVNELHYPLADGSIGLNIIPVADRASDNGSPEYDDYPQTQRIGGSQFINGCENLDDALRKAYGVSADAEIVAILSYQHFENDSGTLQDLASPGFLKTENSQTHSALYIGQGQTRNSPYNYHGKRLQVKSYPANVYIVKPGGIDTNVFLMNWSIASRLINEAGGRVKFPRDYMLDNFHLVSLKEVLHHFRGWIDKEWINTEVNKEIPFHSLLVEQNVFALYCCEFTTFSLNLALNLPFNRKGFQEAFGVEIGEQLWDITKKTWKDISGKEIPNVPNFTPFWKQNSLDSHSSVLGEGLAFKPQNTGDIISCFMKMYCPWPELGAGLSSTILLSFLPEVMKRTGLNDKVLMPLFLEVVHEMAFYSSLASGAELGTIITDVEHHVRQSSPELAEVVREKLLSSFNSNETKERRQELLSLGIPTTERAYGLYYESVKKLLAKMDHVDPGLTFEEQLRMGLAGKDYDTKAKFYSPPAIFHRIATNLYQAHDQVSVVAIATIMDAADVEIVGEAITHAPNATELSAGSK